MPILRQHLRAEIHRAVLERILRGEIKPESRIRDSQLAADLGVSRTPIREALLQLEKQGFLQTTVGKGFKVTSLSAQEVSDIYPIVWALECLALDFSAELPKKTALELEKLTSSIERKVDDPEVRIELDTKWHKLLLSGCTNRPLLRAISEYKDVVRRYEYAYMKDQALVKASVADHRELAELVLTRDLKKAKRALETHWRFSMDALVNKFTSDSLEKKQ